MIVDITISCRSFVLSRSRAKVSAGLINVSSLTVVAFYLEKLLCLSSSLSLSLTLVISLRTLVIGLCATRMVESCSKRAIVSEAKDFTYHSLSNLPRKAHHIICRKNAIFIVDVTSAFVLLSRGPRCGPFKGFRKGVVFKGRW